MTLLNSLTSNISKFIAILSITLLAAGCASVTDASLDNAPQQPDQVHVQKPNTDNPDGTTFSNGDDMDVIVDKPKL